MSLLKKANNQGILNSKILFTFTLFDDLFIFIFIVYYLFIAESSKTFQ